MRKAKTKHGLYTAEAVAERRAVAALLRQVRTGIKEVT
jgi:hypothetical protein